MRKREKVALSVAGSAVAVAIAVVAALMLWPGGQTPPHATPAPRPTGSSAPTTQPPGPVQPGAVVVKIDNVTAARPQTGLGTADVVYVEPVEGGLTRLAAVYTGELPDVVGPVRCARESDIQLLAQYGRPVLAFSGAANDVLDLLAASPVIPVSPAQSPSAFLRDGDRAAPHNLFVDPTELPAPAATGLPPVLQFGPTPSGGTPVAAH